MSVEEKEKASKIWSEIFLPACFGSDKDATMVCVNLYYKHSTYDNAVLPCRYFDRCIRVHSDRILNEYKEKTKHGKKSH